MKIKVLDYFYLQMVYYKNYRRFFRLRRPVRFSEKLFHRMLNPLPEYTFFADKVEVRGYVTSVVGEQYLIPCYGVFDEFTCDNLLSLPDNIVIKASHGAGQVIVVDKIAEADADGVVKRTRSWLKDRYGKSSGEKHYLGISPRIMVEKSLVKDGRLPLDYKVHVFNPGNDKESVCFIQLISGRGGKVSQTIYDEEWKKTNFWRSGYKEDHINSEFEKPEQLTEMLDLARKLTGKLGYCRVDFYISEGRVYFGEMTLTPVGGRLKFEPDVDGCDLKFGELYGWPEKPSAL